MANIQKIKEKTGSWLEMCQLSSVHKAWRENIRTGSRYGRDIFGFCKRFDIGNELGVEVSGKEIEGYLDWKPV